jgi:hypothetical protein
MEIWVSGLSFLYSTQGEESHLNNPKIDVSFDAAICTEMKFSVAPSSFKNHKS